MSKIEKMITRIINALTIQPVVVLKPTPVGMFFGDNLDSDVPNEESVESPVSSNENRKNDRKYKKRRRNKNYKNNNTE